MSSIITNQFRTAIAKNFLSLAATDNLYLFISRPQQWQSEEYAGNPAVSELTPPVPNDNSAEFVNSHNNMIGIKKINSTDLSLVIKKIVWQPGVIYDMYKHNYSQNNPTATGSTILADSNFYIVNSQFQVFKCIYNGQTPETPLGIPTTIGSEPTVIGSSTAIVTTSDGYKWKYLFSLTTNQVLKFANNNYIPVLVDSVVSIAAAPGSISQLNILNRGTNLTPGTYYSRIIGNGEGGIIRIIVPNDTLDPFNQKIGSVSVISGGTDYTYAKVNLGAVFSDILCTIPSNIGTINNSVQYLEVIIPPILGHGSDPEKELFAHRVVIAPKLESIDQDIPVNIQYRQFGLFINPKVAGTDTLFDAATGNCTTRIKFPNTFVGTFVLGERVVQAITGAIGNVVAWDVVNKILSVYQNQFQNNFVVDDFAGANTVTAGGLTGVPEIAFNGVLNYNTFINGYSTSEIEKYSGEILYIENRGAINRSLDQTEQILLIIEL
jgi:hypothetical protein